MHEEAELREVILKGADEDVRIMTITSDYVIWVSVTGHLYVWDRRPCGGDGGSPQCLSSLGFNPPPHLIAATDDGEVVLFNGAYIGLYAIERQLLSATLTTSCDVDDSGLPLREELSLKEVFVTPCRVRGASHLALSEDGTVAALSSPEALVLANCRELSEAENRDGGDPFDAEEEDSSGGADDEMTAKASILRVDCAEWFGQDVRGGSGCALTCFLSAARLAILGTGNHLVSVSLDWVEQTVWLARDGHVVTRKHNVLSLSAKGELIALGISDGSVKLLQSDTLAVFKTVSVASDIERHLRSENDADKAEQYAQKPWTRPICKATGGTRHAPANMAAVKGKKVNKDTGMATASPPYASVECAAGFSSPRSDSDLSAPQREGEHSFRPYVLEVVVGNKDIMVAFPDVVVRISCDTLRVDEEGAFFYDAEDGKPMPGMSNCTTRSEMMSIPTLDVFQVRCASDGSWATWSAFSSSMLYYVAPPWQCPDKSGETDIVHASAPLRRNWAVAVDKLRKQVSDQPSSESKQNAGKRMGTSKTMFVTSNKPVTFGRQIKSSGYGEQVPWSVQQERKKNAAERSKRLAEKQLMGPVPGTGPATYRRVAGPYEEHRYTPMGSANRVLSTDSVVHRSAVLSAAFTASGEGVVTTSGSGGYYLKLPVSRYKGAGVTLRPTTMHDGAVTLSSAATMFLCSSANLSLKTPILATGSADGKIHLWKPCGTHGAGGANPGRRGLGRNSGTFGDGGGDTLRPGATPILCDEVSPRNEVRNVRFFYLDKFLAYSAGASVGFCPYWLDEHRRESTTAAAALQSDLNRLKNDSALGPSVFTYKVDAQHVTSMDCINHFASSLVLLAGSNKSLTILDINAEAPLRVVKDAHKRSIHKVALAASSASRFAVASPLSSAGGASPASQHLFASAGLDNAATLWDLRQASPVRQFALHKNAALTTVGLAFDPTATLLSVGSEDRAMYIYDVRVPSVALDVVKCGDVPSSIAFHPLEPVMAMGLTSGAVLFYSQKGE